jgi:hypothetical protein
MSSAQARANSGSKVCSARPALHSAWTLSSRAASRRHRAEGVFHRAVPEQGGGFFDAGLGAQGHRILAAVIEPTVFDQRERRFQHRQAPVQRCPRHSRGLRPRVRLSASRSTSAAR